MSRRVEADRWTAITWHKEGLKVADIAHKTGFDRQFITRWIKKFESGDAIEDQKRSGRPRKRTADVERDVEREMRGKRRRSSRVVSRDLKRRKVADLSYRTVQRAAHNLGLRSYRCTRTSRLTPQHKKMRLKFATTKKRKDWSTVVFSDEHKFNRFKRGNPVHDQVWAKSQEEVPGKEVERWGLTVDVWAGVSSRGKTKLCFYEGGLNAQDYQQILKRALVPATRDWFKDGENVWQLQQDNATAHTAKSTRRFLEQEHIDVVEDWPTKGDDINPIENLWAILDERLEEKKFKTKKGMKKAIMGIWEKVDHQLLHNLVSSVPDRLRRIIKAKGGSIKRVH